MLYANLRSELEKKVNARKT